MRPRLCVRIAWDTAGVGVKISSPADHRLDAVGREDLEGVAKAGSDSAWVSVPMNSGPSIDWLRRRYSQMACVMARMCHSLNARSNDEPRCPDVPNATRSRRDGGVGPLGIVRRDELRHVD